MHALLVSDIAELDYGYPSIRDSIATRKHRGASEPVSSSRVEALRLIQITP